MRLKSILVIILTILGATSFASSFDDFVKQSIEKSTLPDEPQNDIRGNPNGMHLR